jgi:hypothetical protein
MTEPDWLAGVDPGPMLDYLQDRPSERKLRLFACACVRRQWAELSNSRSREAVEVSERFADGRTGEVELTAAWQAGQAAIYEESYFHIPALMAAAETANADIRTAVRTVLQQLALKASREAAFGCVPGENEAEVAAQAAAVERLSQAAVLRECFGNPFRPAPIDPGWLHWNDRCVEKMARVIYDEQRFEDLPILADALEEAGCTTLAILSHLRSVPRPASWEAPMVATHVRGCWVLDTLLAQG